MKVGQMNSLPSPTKEKLTLKNPALLGLNMEDITDYATQKDFVKILK